MAGMDQYGVNTIAWWAEARFSEIRGFRALVESRFQKVQNEKDDERGLYRRTRPL